VTTLAEERHLADEHPVVVGPVGIVARDAALADRRVLPQVGSALVGMARRATLVNRRSHLEQLDVRAPVDVVARRTGQRALADRHVVEPELLVRHAAVTRGALLRYGLGLELGWALGTVDAVARRAGDVPLIVLTAFPQRMRSAVVARRARLARFRRREFGEAPDEGGVSALGMLLPGTMAALAPTSRRRCSRFERVTVPGASVGLILVTRQARGLADVADLRRRALGQRG